MGFEEIVTLIGNYAFPIAMCILMFIRMEKQDEQHKAEMTALRDSIEASSNKTSEALNNNTLALNTLIVKLGKGE